MLSLAIVSISLIIIFVYYAFGTSSETSVFIDFYPQINTNINSALPSTLDIQLPYVYSKSQYLNETREHSQNVIAFLVASFAGDIRKAHNPYPTLRNRIMQIDKYFNDSQTSDLIIFHTGYPFREDLIPIMDSTTRYIVFVNVDHIFYRFSPGFQPHLKEPTWSQRGKWNYHHMCYFWFKQVFELKIVQRYRYMMRLDDDSSVYGAWPNIFEVIAQRNAVYIANKRIVNSEDILPGMKLVGDLTVKFVKTYKIIPRNPTIYRDVLNNEHETPSFANHFEVMDISFFLQKEVITFTRWVDESKGIFLYRWSDASLRYIILGLFANATQILHREKLGLEYCHAC